MKKIHCDRCGKEIDNNITFHIETFAQVLDGDYAVNEKQRRESLPEKNEFCRDCIEEIEAFVLKKKEETPKLGRPSRINLDMGKVMAMRNAKPPWSYNKIADEFGVDPSTVWAAVKKYEEEQLKKGANV